MVKNKWSGEEKNRWSGENRLKHPSKELIYSDLDESGEIQIEKLVLEVYCIDGISWACPSLLPRPVYL